MFRPMNISADCYLINRDQPNLVAGPNTTDCPLCTTAPHSQRTSSSYDIAPGAVILRAPMMLSDAGSISMKQKPAGKMFVSVASGFSTTLKVAGSFTGTKVLDVE